MKLELVLQKLGLIQPGKIMYIGGSDVLPAPLKPEQERQAVAALEQVGLITAADRGGAKFWELVPATGKKNLADAPILKCLEER